jgi:hypothetical protein
MGYSSDLSLFKNINIPLGLTSTNDVVFLRNNFENDSLFDVRLSSFFSNKSRSYSIDDSSLKTIFKNDPLYLSFFDLLKSITPTVVPKNYRFIRDVYSY